jgi:hypothetical protein
MAAEGREKRHLGRTWESDTEDSEQLKESNQDMDGMKAVSLKGNIVVHRGPSAST